MRVRPVYCVDSPDEFCAAIFAAVTEMNAMVGREIFHYDGELTKAQSQAVYERGGYVVSLVDSLKAFGPGTLGVTFTHVEDNACISRVLTAIDAKFWTARSRADSHITILHEMCHGIGAAHTDPRSSFASPMLPVAYPNAKFGQLDIRTLRDVYGD